MNIDSILQKVLLSNQGKRHYQFANADGKIWLMPAHHLRTAMELYQPSGSKGKLLKCLFPLLHHSRLVRKAIHTQIINCQLKQELQLLLAGLFHAENLQTAIFCGTPSVHQKITMQVSQDQSILGYCKISEDESIAHLFQKESNLLKFLTDAGIQGIPHILFCGCTEEGIHLLVQTTIKTTNSQVLHQWTSLHENFLQQLYQKTQQCLPFEKTDFYHQLQSLMNHLEWLPDETMAQTIKRGYHHLLKKWQGQEVTFAVCHADFTPWNMFVEKGQLFVFDWEYAQRTYPLHLDRYHFFTQTAIFERKWNAQDILPYIHSPQGQWIDRDTYIAYLMDTIARFTLREQGKPSGNTEQMIRLWSTVLEPLTPKVLEV